MLDQDIVINGVSINKLFEDKKAIQQEAANIIATKIAEATNLVCKLQEVEDAAEVEPLIKAATEALNIVSIVSGVSGVQFYLPYWSEYGDNDYVLSRQLEESENEILQECTLDALSELVSLVSDMEYDSKNWNMSNC